MKMKFYKSEIKNLIKNLESEGLDKVNLNYQLVIQKVSTINPFFCEKFKSSIISQNKVVLENFLTFLKVLFLVIFQNLTVSWKKYFPPKKKNYQYFRKSTE